MRYRNIYGERVAPQLRYNNEFGRWELGLPNLADDFTGSYSMLVDTAHGTDDDRYRFLVWISGEWFDAVTFEQHRDRVGAIIENEGQEVAEIWAEHQTDEIVLTDSHPVFRLRDHWEAMMTLGLFSPSVTMSPRLSKPVPPETQKLLDAARRRVHEENMQEMAEAMCLKDQRR